MFPRRGSIASNSVVINDDEMKKVSGTFFACGPEPSGLLIVTPNTITFKPPTASQVEGLDVHIFEDFDVACV